MKKRQIIIFLIITCLVLSSCSPVAKDKEALTFSFMEGVTALGGAKMIVDNMQIGDKYHINYEILNSIDLLTTKIIKEEAHIAIIPTTLAAQSFNKDMGYIICGTSTWGNLYIVGKEDLKSIEDLKGKELHTFGRGLTPDLVLSYILNHNNIDPLKDISIIYNSGATEVAPLILGGKADFALLPEPLLSSVLMKDKDLKILFDLNQLWNEALGVEKGYPQSSLVIKEELIKDDPQFVMEFLKAYEESIQWGLDNIEALGDLSEELKLGPPKVAIINGKNRLGIGDFNLDETEDEYQVYFQSIIEFAPEFIGGKVPHESIYFQGQEK